MGSIISFLSASIPVPDLNWVGTLVAGLYGFIGNYGWTVVVFALILKLISLPIEFWQRCSTKKNAVKMEQMKPMLDKIEKAYGENKKGAQQEKNKIMKKYGYSMFSSCLPTLVTAIFFIFMFTGLTSYTTHANVTTYNSMVDTYQSAIVEYAEDNFQVMKGPDETFDAYFIKFTTEVTDEEYKETLTFAQKTVGIFAGETRESFLWIKNVWRPDTWSSVMPTYKEFSSGSIAMGGVSGASEGEYNQIYQGVEEHAGGYDLFGGSWNGLLILPLLAAVLSFVSAKLSGKVMQMPGTGGPNDPAAKTTKSMQIMMPVLMVFFVLMYTAALGIYIVFNSLFSILSTLLITPIVNKIYSKKNVTIVNKASYRR